MATTLEQYYQMKQQINTKIEAGTLSMEQFLGYQELLYWIAVLESSMTFIKTAPVTADPMAMSYHYQIVDSTLSCLLEERQLGIPADEKLKAQRTTARNNLQTVVNSFRKQFQSFATNSYNAYRDAIAKMLNTILMAWLQYRFTYVPF